jgi:hypothetical protein
VRNALRVNSRQRVMSDRFTPVEEKWTHSAGTCVRAACDTSPNCAPALPCH